MIVRKIHDLVNFVAISAFIRNRFWYGLNIINRWLTKVTQMKVKQLYVCYANNVRILMLLEGFMNTSF